MTKEVTTIKLSKSTKLVTASPYGWFYSEGNSINSLHNLAHNTLAIIIPNADFYIEVKLNGSKFKKDTTLQKIYSNYCQKFRIKNIFAQNPLLSAAFSVECQTKKNMTLNEFVEKTTVKNERFLTRPQIYCKDGFYMSVQGSDGHYCSPRKVSDYYLSMEIGFPSATETDLLEYAEDAEDENTPTDTVYGYVPVEIIQSVIDKHGGIDLEKTFASEAV